MDLGTGAASVGLVEGALEIISSRWQ